MKKAEMILCQYCATGVFFYAIYENGVEIATVSSLVVPKISEVRIRTKFGNFVSFHDMEVTIFRGLKRLILNEQTKVAAELIWSEFDKFTLKAGKEVFDIFQYENGFEGISGKRKIFEAKMLGREQFCNHPYSKMGYDLTRMYKINFEEEVTEQMKVWIGAYPMLKFV